VERPDEIAGEVRWLEALHPDAAALILCVDGKPTAWTDGHGTWIDWRSDCA